MKMDLSIEERPQITLNKDKLSTIIRGHFSEFYNKPMTSDAIESITLNLIEEFERFLNADI